MSLINCDNVCFSYEGCIVANEINFTVEAGDYICIVGENGAGKNTLVKGLLQLKSPSRGSLSMGDGLEASEIGYLITAK